MKNLNEQVTEYIGTATDEHILIMEQLRQLIHTSVPDVTEQIKWGFPVFKKDKDFAYMNYSKKHVTLGFYNFEKINDAQNLLEGTGKKFRHLKIKALQDIDDKMISEWLKAVAD